jgi:hypothetical protein
MSITVESSLGICPVYLLKYWTNVLVLSLCLKLSPSLLFAISLFTAPAPHSSITPLPLKEGTALLYSIFRCQVF